MDDKKMDFTTAEDMRVYELKTPWERLIESVRHGKGKEPFDTKTFAEGMRDTFEYFFSKDAEQHELTKAEISLYGSIYAYTKLPNLYENESYDDFKKSQHAATILSFVILFKNCKKEHISGTKLHHPTYDNDDQQFKIFEYDIMTDDMGEFKDKYPKYEEGDYSWRESLEDGSDYGIDPEDYDDVVEYIDALEEAKYEWRIDYLDCTDYDINPFDYETEEEYLEALEDAKADAEQ